MFWSAFPEKTQTKTQLWYQKSTPKRAFLN